MIWLTPLALILASLGLVILAFHIRRRRTLDVPSLVIWRRVSAGQIKRNRVLQWPQPSWALFLQLLAVFAMVAALAQPLFNRGDRVDHWIFVIERSGPMQAEAGGTTLLETAKQQLTSRLASAAGGARVSLIATGSTAQPLLARRPLAEAGLNDAIASITAEDGATDWKALPELIAPLLVAGERTEIVVYSDRAPPLDLAAIGPDLTLDLVALAPDTANGGLVARLVPDKAIAGKWTLSGTIRIERGPPGAELVVTYASNGSEQPLEWTRRTIGNPTDEAVTEPTDKTFTVPLELPGPGIVTVSLASDGNPYDNTIRVVTNETAGTLDILYIGAGTQPLLSALRSIDGAAIYQAPGLPANVGQYDLVVVDNQHLPRQPETNTIWIGDAGVGDAPLLPLGAQTATAAQSAHPVMRDIAWSGIAASAAFTIQPDANADIVLRAGDTPLLTIAPHADGQNIVLAFDPRQSSWPQQPGLPVFAANLVAWLGIAPQGILENSCVVGALCTLDRRYEGGTLISLADGENETTLSSASFMPGQAGLYELAKGDRRQLLAINPTLAPLATAGAVSSGSGAFPLPLWPFLIGVALLALIAEAIISGRGAERFLRLDGLRSVNPMANRRRVILALRVLVAGLVIAALVNIPLPFRQGGETLVQVLAAGGTSNDTGTPTILASSTPQSSDTVSVAPTRNGDMGLAVSLAAASVPWGEPGHIVVSGQSQSDRDSLVDLSKTLASRNVVLDVMNTTTSTDPLLVTALEAPSPVFAGDTFQLVGIVRAAEDIAANLVFARDGETLVEQSVALVRGDNRVETILSDIAEGKGEYSLTVTSAADASTENNTLSTVVDAAPAGQIAVIANDAARAGMFINWLDSQGISGTAIEPKAAPYKLDEWKAFDGAVLLDVPAIALTTQQQEQIEQAVATQGLGMLILGGPNSFGPGGYLETPLDRASPLSSRVPRDAPEATLVFVLDRSGSMQQPVGNGTRLDIAKQATLAAIRLLNRNSQVGIIVFDSEPTTVLPLGRIDNPEVVAEALSNVDPGGGTSVYPGLQAAFEALRTVDTPARHIIVMTDGLSQPADFPRLLTDIRDAGITVSSVSIGKGAERTLIEQIARLGGGTFHATDDFAALPSILSQEAMLLSGSPIEQGTTQPLWAARNEPFLRGLPAQMPPIDGFVLTTPKPEASLSIVVPDSKGEPMPLLASWRYGAGQVLALTTEAVGPWSSQWQGLEAYPALWAQALRQFLPGVERGDLVLNIARQGDGFVADLVVQGTLAGVVPTLAVTRPDATSADLPLLRTSADRYRATVFPAEAGQFSFAANAGAVALEKTVMMNYPAHLGAVVPDRGLRQLAIASAGQVDVAAPSIRDLPTRWAYLPFWPLWLALALAALMVELTIRYTRLFAPRRTQYAPERAKPVAETAARSRTAEHTS